MLDALNRTRRFALKKKHLHSFLDDVYGRASPGAPSSGPCV